MRLLLKSEVFPTGEVSLSGKSIFAGHDPARCQLFFDRARWPMVARMHAEFRVVGDACRLFNLDSDSDTYVDGKKVAGPSPVRAGSQLQFGPDGPHATVLRVETVDSPPPPPAALSRLVNAGAEPGGTTPPRTNADKRPPVKPAALEVVGDYPASVRRLEIKKEVVRVGRSPESDIVFEASAHIISRRHAEIRRTSDGYVLSDLNSFNGTLLNRQRITGPCPLRNGDAIQLGIRGPILRFRQTGISLPAPTPQLAARALQSGVGAVNVRTVPDDISSLLPPPELSNREPLYVLSFDGRRNYVIGRAADSDVKLDGLQISQRHAIMAVEGGRVFIEDNRSTNGVFVNGLRLMGRMQIGPQDVIQIGPFVLRADPRLGVEVFDTRAQMRIDCIGLTKIAPDSKARLLDDISLTIRPNEFVGLLGPSGAGKSTLIEALNGVRPATAGRVLVNNLDLYKHLHSLKQSIGYVPQDDIIHQELTVYRTLYYVARLRLSSDVSEEEIGLIINEVLDVTGLTERRDLLVAQLSGGQRKRISVAVELLTKPSIIFLDEPTSGLDPVAEEKIMRLFRRIADSGHTVVLTTHTMENVRLFDKLVILMQGKLIFYGTPAEALSHVKAASFKELYDRLEKPISHRAGGAFPLSSNASPEGQQRESGTYPALLGDDTSEIWRERFRQTAQYEQNVRRPQGRLPQMKTAQPPPHQHPTFRHSLSQWVILCRRYVEILKRDRFNLMILFAQAPVIAFLTWLAVAPDRPRDFLYFILSLVPIWFGTSVAAREFIRERAVYRRERMVNLAILPYVGSKLGVLSLIVSLQCLLLLGTLKCFSLFGILKLPTLSGGFLQLLIMILAGMVGIATGLLVSALVKTSELATSFVPLLLIPQILFCGLTGVPQGVAAKTAGALMPATWSFDEMKRLSAREVNVLRGVDEGAEPAHNNDGHGLFKQINNDGERKLKDKEQELNDYYAREKEKAKRSREAAESARRGTARHRSPDVELEPPPAKASVSFIPDDLSDYVDFLHPWGGIGSNPAILLLIFLSLVTITTAVLRAHDPR